MRWFRFYDEVADDPKVQELSHELFRAWVNILCLCSRNEGMVPDKLAFRLRVTEAKAQAYRVALENAGLLDCGDDGALRPHKWDVRQYDSDSSAERMRRHREKKRDVTSTVTVTSPIPNSDGTEQRQSRTETETEQKSYPQPVDKLVDPGRVFDALKAIAAAKTDPGANGNHHSDFTNPEVRKQAWVTKITNEIKRSYPDHRAEEILNAFALGEPWAKAEFNKVDQMIKQRRLAAGGMQR